MVGKNKQYTIQFDKSASNQTTDNKSDEISLHQFNKHASPFIDSKTTMLIKDVLDISANLPKSPKN